MTDSEPYLAMSEEQSSYHVKDVLCFSHLSLVKPLLASHLHPTQMSIMTSVGPALQSKTDCFQSSLTKKGYKVVAMSVRALNKSSLLLAYQELQDEMMASPAPDLWEELCVVTDLFLLSSRSAEPWP